MPTCSSATALTGRSGRFSVDAVLVARCTQWSVNPTLATSSEWGDSDSAGYTNRTIGRRDATFTAEGKFDTGSNAYTAFKIGDAAIEAVLWMNEADGAVAFHFPCCICTDFSLSVDIDSEEVQGWSASFGADGIFYAMGGSDPPDYA